MIASPDQQLDRVLNALRDAPPPAGLAARVNARLLQAAGPSVTHTNSFSAVILSFAKDPRILLGSPIRIAWATTACAAIIAIALLAGHRQTVSTLAEATPSTPVADTSQTVPAATTRVAQGFSLGSHRGSIEIEEVLTPDPDLDAIALAETLAPSHPAPPLPLTAQEALLLRSTRQGQPIEVAELDSVREPALRALAAQRERTSISQYIHSLLGPLAAAESISPTTPAPGEAAPVAAPAFDPVAGTDQTPSK